MITQFPRQGIQRTLAFSIAAAIFLIISLVYPFLSFSSSGLESVMTLPEASLTIYKDGDLPLAVIIFGTIIGAPALLLCALLALTFPLVIQKSVPWLRSTGKLVIFLNEWNMVEVFIIGVIVSLVKIAKLATVILGLSFWAYIVFTVCLVAAMSGLDRWRVWNQIEDLSA
ncbi:MAG: paraquat-inducible protein A [Gammaproteobacteria bacterium]